ncbi:MAG: Hint domain-containing protein [Dehalococcoidales bacterium]|nr:Hint domain-containing protein [Dehalococcoidales bacterium]
MRTGQGQGQHIEGTITSTGDIKVTKQETSFNTCPICLTRGTLIDTPDGPVPVEQLRPGMPVWTADEAGNRISGTVAAIGSTPIPASFQVIKMALADGRTVTASPGHPAADGRPLSDYLTGEVLDGSVVITMEYVAYDGGATYDLLPSGVTGLYWANGILLRSTLFQSK